MSRPYLVRIVLAVAAVGCLASLASASTGTRWPRPDRSFGGGRGWVTTRIPGASSVAYAAAVNQNGRLVVAGEAITRGGNAQIVVLRYRRNGRLDTSFGSRGVVETSLPAAKGPYIAQSIARQGSTGRLLIAGGYGLDSMLVMRLTANGRLDRSFGRRGLATVAVGGIAQSLIVQEGGAIVVGGSNANANGRPMVVARFSRNGALDRRFGHRGLAQVLFWNPELAASAGATGLASAPGNGIIAAGHLDYIGSDGHGSAGVFRLSSRGRLVRGFGTGGHTEVAYTKSGGGFAQWFPCAMTRDSRGRTVVAGDGSAGRAASLLSIRLTGGGRLDPSYGRGGRAVSPGLRSDSDTTCGSAASRGGITVGVGSTVTRLRPNGSSNARFGRRGVFTVSRPRGVSLNAVVAVASGRVTVAGAAGNSIYVARYLVPAGL
ncbi:MAG TPA: hypothetical protein VGH45_01865 [Solirubrobacteraceae bacterium]